MLFNFSMGYEKMFFTFKIYKSIYIMRRGQYFPFLLEVEIKPYNKLEARPFVGQQLRVYAF